MFPIRDENPLVHRPFAVVAIIALNVYAWLAVQGLGSPEPLVASLCEYGLIPGELLGTAQAGTSIDLGPARCVLQPGTAPWTPLTSM